MTYEKAHFLAMQAAQQIMLAYGEDDPDYLLKAASRHLREAARILDDLNREIHESEGDR